MKLSTLLTRKTAVSAVAAVGLAAAATGLGIAPASAASVAGTLSSASGPSAGGNTLTMTTATAKFFAGYNVEFQAKTGSVTACSANYSTPGSGIIAATPKILSSTKIAFTVPSTVLVATAANWFVCVYPGTSTTTSALVANAAYTVATKPTLTSISPAGGPALGGGTVTLTGTGFITGLTAKIGSVALTGVTVQSATTATGVVPPQAAGAAMSVTVTTTGGSATKTAAYTYSNGIIISPATTPTATAATDLDIQGVGFSSLDFDGVVSGGTFKTDGSAPDDGGAHVYVVNGDYDPTDSDATHATPAKTVPEVGECMNVLVVSDTELICTVNTAHGTGGSSAAIGNGTYTVSVVSDGRIDATAGTPPSAAANLAVTSPFTYTESIISSGSTFTVAPY